MTSTTRLLATLFAAARLLAACDSEPARDDSGAITEQGDVDAFNVRVGDCINPPEADEVASVAAVPCSEPHQIEIFHVFDMPDGVYPGAAAVETAAETTCTGEQFTTFIGVDYAVSEYFAGGVLFPTEQS